MMKVRIIRSISQNFWYSERVGDELTYEGLADDGGVIVEAFIDGERLLMPIRAGDYEMIVDELGSKAESVITYKGDIKMIYVACSLSASTDFERNLNIDAARHAGYKLAKAGFYPVIPTVNTAGFEEANTLEFWYASTMELLRRCDAVYVVDGSHESSGVKAEVDEAARLDIPVCCGCMETLISTMGDE